MPGAGGSAPDPDPRIGEAAKISAWTGRKFLDFMREQADVANRWATEDRNRSISVYRPIEDQYIEDNKFGAPDYSGVEQDVQRATADVRREFDIAQGQRERQMARMGVAPGSGRWQDDTRKSDLTEALAVAGTSNSTRLRGRDLAEAEAEQKQLNVLNMGKGLAVNPATSLGLANSAGSEGYRGSLAGQGQAGRLYQTDYNNRLNAWQANQQSQSSLMSGLGTVAGYALSVMSSKDYKEGRQPARGVLDVARDMPVDSYRYKDGIADGGAREHVGPMAEDFHAASGKGDGRTIPLQDLAGITLGAVQELADKVDALEGKVGGGAKPAASGGKSKRGGRGVLDVAA